MVSTQFPDGSKWWQCAKFVKWLFVDERCEHISLWADQSLESKIGKVK